MKKFLLTMIIGASFCINLPVARADSPITSTGFSNAYKDVSIIKKARKSGKLSNDMADFLSSPVRDIDQKMALINGLSWKFEGKQNAYLYMKYLAKKYQQPMPLSNTTVLTADEMLSLGYLLVMDDYFNPQLAIPLLEQAVKKKPNSLTFGMILSLTQAQAVMDNMKEWCSVWLLTKSVLTNPNLKKDMREKALKEIVDYMKLYKDSCKK